MTSIGTQLMICKPWLEFGEKDRRDRCKFTGLTTPVVVQPNSCIFKNFAVLFSHRLITTGTIEEKIFQRQILKQGLSGTIVDARDSKQGHFTREELKVCFAFKISCCFGLKQHVFMHIRICLR